MQVELIDSVEEFIAATTDFRAARSPADQRHRQRLALGRRRRPLLRRLSLVDRSRRRGRDHGIAMRTALQPGRLVDVHRRRRELGRSVAHSMTPCPEYRGPKARSTRSSRDTSTIEQSGLSTRDSLRAASRPALRVGRARHARRRRHRSARAPRRAGTTVADVRGLRRSKQRCTSRIDEAPSSTRRQTR